MDNNQPNRIPLLAAWIVVILTSLLPIILLQEIFKQPISPEQRAIFSLSVIGAAFLAALIWKPLRSLNPFLVLFAVLVAAQWLVYNRIDRLPIYQDWLRDPSFSVSMLAEQSLNLMIAIAVIVTLLLLRKKPKDFYLAVGDVSAASTGARWIGIKPGDRWNHIGWVASAAISLGTLAFLVIAGRPPLDIVVRVLPFLPAVLLAAALNAFYEEVTYKAATLSVLAGPVSPQQALYMVAFYFGIWHFYGVPYGVVGVILATFLGWFLAKSMQETGGMFWAWFIHFLQDVWIFAFLAIGSITPGG